ncbi:MAG: hypothetical protein EXS64_02790 [Candidatus Latescibacteria bacterium]|nr:hypothetical protein [Candidatus Latescibacterota bacterium]
MTRTEILEGLSKLSPQECLEVIEAAVHLIQKDIERIGKPLTQMERKRRLEEAATALLPDYTEDDELTSFTVLDRESFHA